MSSRTASLSLLLVPLLMAAGCGKKDTPPPAPPETAAPVEPDTVTAPAAEADTAAPAVEADTAAPAVEADTAAPAAEADTAAPAAAEADTTTAAVEADAGAAPTEIVTADLTGLTPPLTLKARVVREPLPKDFPADCQSGTLLVDVIDAAGKQQTLTVGAVTGMANADALRETALAPTEAGGYEDLGVWCAGLQSGWTITKDGDTLVATDVWTDESTGEGKKPYTLAKLPAGAKVDAR